MTNDLPVAAGEQVLELIPQRPPFVLVDTLLAADDVKFETAFTVPDAHVLVEDGQLSEAGLLEHVAQSAALGIGYRARVHGRRTPLGFIGALGPLSIAQLPRCGTRVHTTIHVRHQVANVHVIEGLVESEAASLATVEMKVVLMEEA